MSTLDEVFACLHDLILERFRAERGGDVGNAFVAFEFGTPIPDDTFRLKDPERTLSPELAVEFLSQHANTVPEVKEMLFRRRPYTVEGQYGLMLAGATAADPSTMEMLGAVKRIAQTNFDQTLGSLVGPYRYRPVYATPLNWYDQTQTTNWTPVSINRSDTPPAPAPTAPKIDPKLRQWRIAPEALRPTLEQPVSATAMEQVRIAPAAQAHFSKRSRRMMLSASERGLQRPLLTQRAFATHLDGVQAHTVSNTALARDVAVARPIDQLAVSDRSVELVAAPARSSATIGSLVAADASLQLQAVIAAEAQEQPVVTDQFGISVEICLVNLHRPWLSDALLTVPGWFVPGFKQGEFSDADEEEAGPFCVLPTACILIRNLTINAQWSDADSAAIEQSANLGSFSLLGRTFDRNAATLTVRGMQSIAWVCEPMPSLPPANPPVI